MEQDMGGEGKGREDIGWGRGEKIILWVTKNVLEQGGH